MKIAVFQMDVIQEAVEWNLDKASLWIEGLKSDVSMTVLPKAFDGSNDEGTIQKMRTIAVASGKAICFTMQIEGHQIFCFVRPDGTVEQVRANSSKVIEYEGIRFHPEMEEDSTETGQYDVAVYSSAWQEKEISMWDMMLRTTAIEKKCYVIGANRVGFRYPGHSMAVDFLGNVIAKADPDLECSFIAEIDKEKLDRFRCKFRTFEAPIFKS